MTTGPVRPDSMPERPPLNAPTPSAGRLDHPHGAATPLRRRWAGRPGVAGRLLVAVLLPITILAIAAGALINERYQTAQQANSVANEIPTLNGLVKLRSLLDQERIPVEASLRVRELGIDAPERRQRLRVLQRARRRRPRPPSTPSCACSGAAAPAGFVGALQALRQEIDAGRHRSHTGRSCLRHISPTSFGRLRARWPARAAHRQHQPGGGAQSQR